MQEDVKIANPLYPHTSIPFPVFPFSPFSMRFLLIVLLTLPSFSFAVHMPEIFASHMVMQRNSDLKIWGWGKP